jgi:dTDP-4-amino-4,6-dideoxygalactose transaminase
VNVPFLELAEDYRAVRSEALARIEAVLDSQIFVLGGQTVELERELMRTTTASHAIACSSGSDALYLALAAARIGPGDAVGVPAFTFFASAGAVVRAGAIPVFLDVDADTLCLDSAVVPASAARLRECGGRLVEAGSGAPLRAIIAVHLYGRACDMRGLEATLAGLTDPPLVIEDAAQAIGARGNLAPVGAWGTAACFSFYPTKNLGGAGDGGAVTTDDAVLAARVARLRVHGANEASYLHEDCGINARLGELQAAYLNAKLPQLAAWTKQRSRLASLYDARLAGLAGADRLVLPAAARTGSHVHHQYTVRVPGRRDEVRAAMARRGVDTRVFYPVPLHLQPCFAALGYRSGELPVSESAARTVLSLPIYPSLGEDRLELVCAALELALEEAS